jgi:hypothetical protein
LVQADHAKYQVVMYRCSSCGAGSQLGAGVKFDVDAAEVERAQCDAQRVSAEAPGPATQDIPKRVRRFVDLRDGKKCRIPGCRAASCLELHHIEHLEDGGTHEPENLISICDGHHAAHQDTSRAHVGVSTDAVATASRFERVKIRTDAVTALKTLGWKPNIAGAAVDGALADLGALDLEQLIRAALPARSWWSLVARDAVSQRWMPGCRIEESWTFWSSAAAGRSAGWCAPSLAAGATPRSRSGARVAICAIRR